MEYILNSIYHAYQVIKKWMSLKHLLCLLNYIGRINHLLENLNLKLF